MSVAARMPVATDAAAMPDVKPELLTGAWLSSGPITWFRQKREVLRGGSHRTYTRATKSVSTFP